jgi:hypothetical protein
LDPTDHQAAAAALPPIDSINMWPHLMIPLDRPGDELDDGGQKACSLGPRKELAIGTQPMQVAGYAEPVQVQGLIRYSANGKQQVTSCDTSIGPHT